MHEMKQHIVLQSLWFSTIFHEEAMVFANGFTSCWTWEFDDNFGLSSVSYQLEGKLSLQKGGIDMIIEAKEMSREKLMTCHLHNKKKRRQLD